jgi:plastocyanin
MSKTQRLTFAGIAAVIALVAVIFLAGGSGSDDEAEQAATPTATATATADTATTEQTPEATETPTPEPTPEVEEIEVEGGEVEGGLAEIKVDKGDTVRFRVKSDKKDHVHVHGYDILRDVEAGGTASFRFKADIVGIFEVELEESRVQVAKLTVEQ